MGSEREILNKLRESRELDEASFESGGSTYKCAFGRYYKDGQQIDRDEYFKAKNNQSSDTPKVESPKPTAEEIKKKLMQMYATTPPSEQSDKALKIAMDRIDKEYGNSAKTQEPTPVHNEETRAKAIKNPEEKKVFIAVSDAMAEYGGQISGDRETDGAAKRYYRDYINTGNVDSLKKVANIMYDLTGSPEYRMKETPIAMPTDSADDYDEYLDDYTRSVEQIVSELEDVHYADRDEYLSRLEGIESELDEIEDDLTDEQYARAEELRSAIEKARRTSYTGSKRTDPYADRGLSRSDFY